MKYSGKQRWKIERKYLCLIFKTLSFTTFNSLCGIVSYTFHVFYCKLILCIPESLFVHDVQLEYEFISFHVLSNLNIKCNQKTWQDIKGKMNNNFWNFWQIQQLWITCENDRLLFFLANYQNFGLVNFYYKRLHIKLYRKFMVLPQVLVQTKVCFEPNIKYLTNTICVNDLMFFLHFI